MTRVQRIAAFSYNNTGGNPAGVVICDEMPPEPEMMDLARQVGYSETAFLHPHRDGWRIRYFAPEIEIPFCGHATIATGAALGEKSGPGRYRLYLNDGEVTIEVTESGLTESDGRNFSVALRSPAPRSKVAPPDFLDQVISYFNFSHSALDPRFPPRLACAGAKHLILVLRDRQTLADMAYDFAPVKALMREQGLATISLLWPETDGLFHARNAFAAGGVYADPATGAAAAAFAGYLRDIDWSGPDTFDILQGADMGSPSLLKVSYTDQPGDSIRVSGITRPIP